MLWIRPLMPRLPEKLLLLCALAALAVACKPNIGDDCQISTDCSAAGDRLCDITAPGGYCTIFNCEPGTCPDGESLCVEFGAQRGRADLCQDKQSPSPYGRAFCMATCKKNSDCRDGYVCADLSRSGNAYDAVLIDRDRGNKGCVVPYTQSEQGNGGAPPDGEFGDVCRAKLPAPSSSAEPDGQGEPDVGEGGAAGG
jgi:hypothetical protein